MNNEEKAKEISEKNGYLKMFMYGVELDGAYFEAVTECYDSAMEMAKFKDEQPIMESDGWHTEQPTEDGWYLVDTPDFPRNCHCVVAEWDNDAKNFYDEHSELPIKFHRWKLIEKG